MSLGIVEWRCSRCGARLDPQGLFAERGRGCSACGRIVCSRCLSAPTPREPVCRPCAAARAVGDASSA